MTTSHQEPLEPRRLFDTLLFEGTAADDVMELDVEKGAIILTLNGAPTFHADDSFDVIDVRGLGGDDAIAVFNSGDNDVLVRGDFADGSGDGDDTIDVGAGNLDAVNTTIEITAGGGTDVARLNDQNNNFSDAFTVNSTRASRPFFFGTTYGSDLETLVVNNGGGSSPIEATTTAATPRLRIDSGPGTDTITVPATHPASPVTVLPAPGDDLVNVGGSGALARVAFDQSQRIGALTVGSAGRAAIVPNPAGEVVLTMTQLTITGTGAFDLADGSAVIDHGGASPASAVRTYLSNGFNNGAWNGSGGIVSSAAASGTNTAIGYAEKTDLPAPLPPQFAGQAIDDTALLLTYTLYGDADLNRTVNLGDFNRLAANFGQSDRRWSQGDFDYNGTVSLSDFNRLAASFGQSLASARGSRLLDELQ